MNRSVFTGVAMMILVAAAFAAPVGPLLTAIGGTVADSKIKNNGGACASQPGQTCTQKYNVCVTGMAGTCNTGGGANGCGNQLVCVPTNNDTTSPANPEE